MLQAILLAAAVSVTTPVRADTAPASVRATVGAWRLSEVGGKVACTLSLTGVPASAGWEIKAPLACRGAFPPLRQVAAWSLDAEGALALTDAEGRRIVTFPAGPAGPMEAKAPDGKTWRLEAVGPSRTLTSRERMSGQFRLSGAGGTSLCDLDLKADIFGRAGWVTSGMCSPAWSAKGFSVWTMKDGRLTLMDRKRKPLLVLKPGDPGVFVATDPAGEALSLGRH